VNCKYQQPAAAKHSDFLPHDGISKNSRVTIIVRREWRSVNSSHARLSRRHPGKKKNIGPAKMPADAVSN